MTVFEGLRLAAGCLLLLAGTFVMATAVVGNYRFHYVLLRMHAAGLGDTMGIVLLFAGITVLKGVSFFTAKLALIVLLLWVASPTASHLILRMEIEDGASADKKERR